jgi:hypothetical protein
MIPSFLPPVLMITIERELDLDESRIRRAETHR